MNETPQMDRALPGLDTPLTRPAPVPAPPPAQPRIRPVDRSQLIWRSVDVEGLIEEDHPARAIWAFTGQLNLEAFYQPIQAVQGVAGRTPWDPRLLVSLWIYAYSRGISSAREIARRCAYDPAFEWLCGLGQINYHTLADFRTAHGSALQELFVEVLGVLSGEGLVTLERVMHDGTKIKACAGADSFRREDKIKAHLEAARQQVQALEEVGEDESARQVAARQRAAREREQMVTDGGFTSRENIIDQAARGVDFIGSPAEHDEQLAGQMRRRGVAEEFFPEAFLYDPQQDSYRCPAGQTLEHVGQEQRPGVVQHKYQAQPEVCQACPFKDKCCPQNEHKGRSVIRAVEAPEVARFLEKMQTPKAKEIYRQRGAVAEFPNAWIKEKLGLRQFRLRGLAKVLLELVWAFLTYHVQPWIRLCWRAC